MDKEYSLTLKVYADSGWDTLVLGRTDVKILTANSVQ